jgi:hypothetical protein
VIDFLFSLSFLFLWCGGGQSGRCVYDFCRVIVWTREPKFPLSSVFFPLAPYLNLFPFPHFVRLSHVAATPHSPFVIVVIIIIRVFLPFPGCPFLLFVCLGLVRFSNSRFVW